MDIDKYIASGILELYIAGTLTEDENLDVLSYARKHPEIQAEIEAIEASIVALTKAATPTQTSKYSYTTLYDKIKTTSESEVKVIPLPKEKLNWSSYLGWAASVLLVAALAWMYTQNNALKNELQSSSQATVSLEKQIEEAKSSLVKSEELLSTIRNKDIQVIALGGQAVDPNSYAKAYWNKKEQQVFIDAQGLPDPPDGMVYQVWSLKLDPLTPTSMGLLENFITDDNRVFALANPNESEAFGITLEPAGGSESPNLEQLYTLGAV
ncbi:anti-sigma factor domain-containing protein [Cellulophaga sp. Hel_I_12]|uniref:anti-sigma factor n=1 Tax=Cellulophaga sp. Hel_I_12 TaxID=1249972 RepID=UPI000647C568|nr:anti-sigma factor [Cellulophaga sp. Hel_I_12]